METEKRLWRSVIIGAVCLSLASIVQPISDYLKYIGSAAEYWLSGLGAILLFVGAFAFISSHRIVGRLRREKGLSERLSQAQAPRFSPWRRLLLMAAVLIGVGGSVVGLVWLRFNSSDPLLRLSIGAACDFALPLFLLLLVAGTWRHRFDEGKLAKLS